MESKYWDFIIKTDRGNRDAFGLLCEIYNWTNQHNVYAYLNKIVPAEHENQYANEFNIHLYIEDCDDQYIKFKQWCDENADNLWGFRSYEVKEAA